MDITSQVNERVALLGEKAEDKVLAYSVKKSLQYAADFCNISGPEYFPADAEIYLIEYAAGDYLLEKCGFSPKWETMRRDAQIGLTRFRRIRW